MYVLHAVSILLVGVGFLWLPLYGSVCLAAIYGWWFGVWAPLLLAISIDWLLAPSWPLLTIFVGVTLLVVTAVRRITMVYT